jgi:hypothetical protein
MTKDILKQFISENADYFICGPVPFMKAVINYLKELGVASENIHYEFLDQLYKLRSLKVRPFNVVFPKKFLIFGAVRRHHFFIRLCIFEQECLPF